MKTLSKMETKKKFDDDGSIVMNPSDLNNHHRDHYGDNDSDVDKANHKFEKLSESEYNDYVRRRKRKKKLQQQNPVVATEFSGKY